MVFGRFLEFHLYLIFFPFLTSTHVQDHLVAIMSKQYTSSARSSIDSISLAKNNVQAQHTGVPVDHRDLNHPHFPGEDVESRSYWSKKRCMSRRALLILLGILLALGSIAIAVFLGIKLTAGRQTPVPLPATNTTSAGVGTVYVTTTLLATTLVSISTTGNVTSSPSSTITFSSPTFTSTMATSSHNPFPLYPAFSWKPSSTPTSSSSPSSSLSGPYKVSFPSPHSTKQSSLLPQTTPFHQKAPFSPPY